MSDSGPSFRVVNANDLSEFKENEFDAAYMNAVFHWLPDKHLPLQQIFRVLKSGGRLGVVIGVKGNSNPLRAVRESVMTRPDEASRIFVRPVSSFAIVPFAIF